MKNQLSEQLHLILTEQSDTKQKIHDVQGYNDKVKSALETFQLDWEDR